MKPWTTAAIRDRLKNPEKLLEKRMCGEHYMNAYEYGLFTNQDLCFNLSNCMHSEGFIVNDTITPYTMHLAMISNNIHNYAALSRIKWNEKTFAGLLKRPDGVELLLRSDYCINGFEFGITKMPKLVGTIIKQHNLKIGEVIRYKYFKKCKGIKNIFV